MGSGRRGTVPVPSLCRSLEVRPRLEPDPSKPLVYRPHRNPSDTRRTSSLRFEHPYMANEVKICAWRSHLFQLPGPESAGSHKGVGLTTLDKGVERVSRARGLFEDSETGGPGLLSSAKEPRLFPSQEGDRDPSLVWVGSREDRR